MDTEDLRSEIHERTLDDEGVPDLEGPLPQKAATGDPQEGMPPPNESPQASVDHGVTVREQREREAVEDRINRENPAAVPPTSYPESVPNERPPSGPVKD